LTIADACGAIQKLYFNVALKDSIEKLSFSLPPVPPAGIFDARFVGDFRMSESSGATIQIQASNYPLTITAGNLTTNENEQYALVEVLANGDGAMHTLEAGSQIKITNPEVKALRLAKVQRLPLVFAVEQNYPNPFNPTTTIKYAIPHDEHVVIEVYNIVGQKVRTVVNEQQKAGRHAALWQSDNDVGQKVGSGVYFYRVTAGDNTVVRKMLLVK
jgi:hypothetical protein